MPTFYQPISQPPDDVSYPSWYVLPNDRKLDISHSFEYKLIRWAPFPAHQTSTAILDIEDRFGWEGLLFAGTVEYLDAEEEEGVMIVMTPEDLDLSRQVQLGYEIEQETDQAKRVKAPINSTTHTWTHCEIHPSMILGICASIVQFPDHNQVCSRQTYLPPLFYNPSPNTITPCSHPVILINPLWVSKLWVSS